MNLKHQSHDSGLGPLQSSPAFEVSLFLTATVAIRRSGKYVDSSLLRHVPFASPAPLGYLRPFIFGNHALKLQPELILRSGSGRRIPEDQLHSTTRRFFAQQVLTGIFSAEPQSGR